MSQKTEHPLWSQDRYIKALRFAADRHNGQPFPGTDLPYLLHLTMVAAEVMSALNLERHLDGDLAVQSALLHDILEDTITTFEEIHELFGRDVAEGVETLTKKETVEKDGRIADSLERIKKQPHEIWVVKMADRITNLQPPPSHWSNDKRKRYREQAKMIHTDLKDASEHVGSRLAHKIDEYGQYI